MPAVPSRAVRVDTPQHHRMPCATAARYLYDPEVRITRDRGKWICKKGVWMLATYHPAALLRDVSKKKEAWIDLQMIRDKLNSIQAKG